MFEYEFMRKAFIVGFFLAITIPLIGTTVVLKRLSMIGDALSHASLAGVTAGIILGVNPVIGAIITCILAAFSIESIRKRMSNYTEVSIAIITSAGVGLAGVMSGFIKNITSFNSFLFGSIVAISNIEVIIIMILCVIVLVTNILLYKEIMHVSFDEESAKLAGINVDFVNFVFVILTAITVSIASRTVGALIVSSLMVVPVATSMMVARSYKSMMIISVIYALVEVVMGITISFYMGLKPGATIVLLAVILFIITSFFRIKD